MNILYCGDSHVADGLVISILSLIKHNQGPFHIYLLTATINTPAYQAPAISEHYLSPIRQQLQKANPDNTLIRIDISDHLAREMPVINLKTIFTPACMLRLFADQVPELPNKILYLDTDVLAHADFSHFYDQNIDGLELVAVLDHYGQWFFHRRWQHRDYMNSGVMLLNLSKIKQTGLFRRSRQLCRVKKMFMPDQSALNKLVSARRLAPRRFNEQGKLHADTVFQHFTTSLHFFPWFHTQTVKPWEVDRMHSVLHLHVYDDLLNEYLALKNSQVKELNLC